MTEKEAQRLTKQAGMGQTVPPAPRRGPKPDGVTSEGEEAFVYYFKVLKPAFPKPYEQRHIGEARQWKVDFCIPEALLYIEIEGIGHRLSPKYESDIYKYNTLQSQGWALLRITAKMLVDDPSSFFALIERTYKERTETR